VLEPVTGCDCVRAWVPLAVPVAVALMVRLDDCDWLRVEVCVGDRDELCVILGVLVGESETAVADTSQQTPDRGVRGFASPIMRRSDPDTNRP
jgi:hypothetical protein